MRRVDARSSRISAAARASARCKARSVATTMGFSALDGLMMGTRCGSLDAGVILYLLEHDKLSVGDLTQLLYRKSGLLGVSGLSSSPKALLEAEDTNLRAHAALELYVRRIVREIGALTAVLGGLDMLAFTAGVGEHSAVLRERHLPRAALARRRNRCRSQPRQCADDLERIEPRPRGRGTDERGMGGGLARPARPARKL